MKKDILIIVKTYPEISRRHTETVCTAGILSDTKSFVRLYPIRFRYLEGSLQFKKYQMIRAEISKPSGDSRPESYTLDPNSIEILNEPIPSGRGWAERKAWVLNKNNRYQSVEALRAAQKQHGTSLGIVKPKKVTNVIIKERNKKEISEALSKKNSVLSQLDLFEEKKDLYILPVKIMIEFSCDDPACTTHTMSVLDWEFGQLLRKTIKGAGWKEKIKSKILDVIFNETRDAHIILGNIAAHPQTFCALGFFYPPKQEIQQVPLFA